MGGKISGQRNEKWESGKNIKGDSFQVVFKYSRPSSSCIRKNRVIQHRKKKVAAQKQNSKIKTSDNVSDIYM